MYLIYYKEKGALLKHNIKKVQIPFFLEKPPADMPVEEQDRWYMKGIREFRDTMHSQEKIQKRKIPAKLKLWIADAGNYNRDIEVDFTDIISIGTLEDIKDDIPEYFV